MGIYNFVPNEPITKNRWKLSYIIIIEIGTEINSWRALSQEFNIFMYQTFHSDSEKNSKFYDDSTFSFQIAWYVQIFSFLSAKLFELWLKINFLKWWKEHFEGVENPRRPGRRTVPFIMRFSHPFTHLNPTHIPYYIAYL